MQHLINYLLQAAISLAFLHGAYRLFIRTETFHHLNRWILSGSLLLSALLPLISIPVIGQQTAGMVEGFSSYLLPVVVGPEVPVASVEGTKAIQTPSLWQLTGWAYIAVSAVLLLRLLFQLAGISRLILRSDKVKQDGFSLIISRKIHTPFSFFRYIFLNPKELRSPQNQEVMDHEEVHASQLHSIDNLLSELYTVVFWFSPVSWWHKKEILLNLEYLADRGALQKGCEPGSYQLQLLRASLNDARFALANHFAQSIIKRRIKMMNTERSPSKRAWKYLLLIPAASAALFLLNCNGEIASSNAVELEIEYDQETFVGEIIDNSVEDEEKVFSRVITGADTNGHREKSYSFANVEKKPVFPGGNDQILGYVSRNFKYPAEAREAGIQGTMYVQFTVKKDGSVDSVKAIRGEDLGGGLVEEAIRVVKAMPAWTPGEHQGKKVNVSYTLPIFARLNLENAPEIKADFRTWSLAVPFADVDKKPQFPGGNDKILSYISENFKYPAEARQARIQGTIYVQFTITDQGKVMGAKVVRGESLGGGLAEEAVRVVSSMPAWTPGEHQGKKVSVSYTLPIFARLQKK